MPKFTNKTFIIIFVIVAILSFAVIYKNFNTWRLIYNLPMENNVGNNNAQTYEISKIDGSLFTIGPSQNLQNIPCVTSEAEALDLLIDQIEKENDSQGYFESEVKPLLLSTAIENDGYSYKLKLSNEIVSSRYSKNLNIFDCDFFEPGFTDYVLTYNFPENMPLGVLNKSRNASELSKLVDILYSFKMIDLEGFGESIKINETKLTENENTITKTDSGVYVAGSDLLRNAQKSLITLDFTLDKQTGQVFITKTER